MANVATVRDLITQTPQNPVWNEGNTTQSNKAWAQTYRPIRNLLVHSSEGQDLLVYADFDNAFLPMGDDDDLRLRAAAREPNGRVWRFESEADCEL